MTIENGRYTFEVVEKIPQNYLVWNIGRNMTAGYLPICEVYEDNKYYVKMNTLKAIAMDEEEIKILNNASAFGADCLKKARRYANMNAKTRYTAQKKKYAALALPIYERITE